MMSQVGHRVSLHPVSIQLFDSSDEIHNKNLGVTRMETFIISLSAVELAKWHFKLDEKPTCILNTV